MVNLTDTLMPKGSPIDLNQGQVSSFNFDSQNERNTITATKIKNLIADVIQAGTITTTINVGGSNITIDGANNRIIVNDGTVDRILIGYLSGGF
jgi:hypothetical protein